MFLGEPRGFAFGLDPGAVNQEVQRTCAWPVGNGDIQTLLATGQRAEIRHWPIQVGQFQQACNQPCACRSGRPNSAFNVRQAWIAASVKVAEQPRLPLGTASQSVSGSNQTSSDPRRLRAAL